VVVADHSRDPPIAILVPPDRGETGNAAAVAAFAGRICSLWVTKQVNPRLNRAISLQRINGECPRNKIPVHFAADIVLDGFYGRLPPHAQPAFIVIELKILS
jgi:hypothetical protein